MPKFKTTAEIARDLITGVQQTFDLPYDKVGVEQAITEATAGSILLSGALWSDINNDPSWGDAFVAYPEAKTKIIGWQGTICGKQFVTDEFFLPEDKMWPLGTLALSSK